MASLSFLKQLASELSSHLPNHLDTVKSDFEKTCQQVLNRALNQLNLVSREEFDVQAKVLARTREKLQELEAKVKELTDSN